MRPLILAAPLRNWACALAEVADPAFAKGLLGPGIALDPLEGLLRAPCKGEVVLVAPALHAVTLRAECGNEILIRVGLDTVALQARGSYPM